MTMTTILGYGFGFILLTIVMLILIGISYIGATIIWREIITPIAIDLHKKYMEKHPYVPKQIVTSILDKTN